MTMLDYLHPEFRKALPALIEIVSHMVEAEPEPEELTRFVMDDPELQEPWQWAGKLLLENRVAALAGNVFAVPFLDPAKCLELVAESERLGGEFGYAPNPEEEEAYQIPEIVLSHVAPELHRLTADLIPFLNIWFMIIYGMAPDRIASIQFAKYEPDGTAKGNWHNDEDSDYTAVVSLAPQLHTGGGTDIRITPEQYAMVPALPAGHALIFNGRQIIHRGRPVESGVRHLLVYWLNNGGRNQG